MIKWWWWYSNDNHEDNDDKRKLITSNGFHDHLRGISDHILCKNDDEVSTICFVVNLKNTCMWQYLAFIQWGVQRCGRAASSSRVSNFLPRLSIINNHLLFFRKVCIYVHTLTCRNKVSPQQDFDIIKGIFTQAWENSLYFALNQAFIGPRTGF